MFRLALMRFSSSLRLPSSARFLTHTLPRWSRISAEAVIPASSARAFRAWYSSSLKRTQTRLPRGVRFGFAGGVEEIGAGEAIVPFLLGGFQGAKPHGEARWADASEASVSTSSSLVML